MKAIISFLTVFGLFFWGDVAFAQNKDTKYKTITLGFYNLENLFDTLDTEGVNDSEFTPNGGKNWNTFKYNKKLNNLSEVIAQLGTSGSGPEILGVAEIENKSVLEDLAKQKLIAKQQYKIIQYNSLDARGIDVALLYNPSVFTPISSKNIPLINPEDTAFKSRDLLYVSGKMDGELVHIMVAHWPSRRGGEKRSRPLRIMAAKDARTIIDSLLNEDKNAKIFFMGDLNDDPLSPSVKKYLKGVGSKDLMTGQTLFNPMVSYYRKGIGTLAWRDAWNLFDQIIVSPGVVGPNDGFTYYGTKIFNKPFIKQFEGQFKGYPYRTYVGSTFMGGYSDHFPVYMYVVKPVE